MKTRQSSVQHVVRTSAASSEMATTRVYFSGKPALTTLRNRESMPAATRFWGPAVVTEYSATTVIPPRAAYMVDRAGNLMIEVENKKKRRPQRTPSE